MARTVLVGQLTTGRRLTQLPVTKADWSVVLNDAGQMSATLKLDTPRVRRRPELMEALQPARSFMAVLEDDTVLEAGPIWSHAYSDTDKTLVLRGSGIRSVFSHRIVMKTLATGENPATSYLTWNGSLGDISRDLVTQALAAGTLPILIGDPEGGSDTRTYAGSDLSWVQDMLAELTGVIAGPDLEFRPRLTDDRQGLVWDMLTGTMADPLLHQNGSSYDGGDADVVFDSHAPKSGITTLDVVRDASKMATRWWASGSGTGESLLISQSSDDDRTDHGWPTLDGRSSYSTVQDTPTLDAHADMDLLGQMRPWTTWTLACRANKTPRLGTYRPGDWARVWVSADHPYLPLVLPAGGDRFYRSRITQFSGDMTPAVSVELAPTMEVR